MPRYHDDDEGHIDMRPLLRIGTGGGCAVREVGAERAQIALATLRDAPRELITHPGNLLALRTTTDDAETRRLNEAVAKLTADRDRLHPPSAGILRHARAHPT